MDNNNKRQVELFNTFAVILKCMAPFVSVIIPTRNESPFIVSMLESIVSQDYPQSRLEIIIADGMSTDDTVQKIKLVQEKHPNIQVIENPEMVVPFALNYAIEKSKGEIIIRLDAHAEYPTNYISQLVKYSVELDAQNVGAPWNTVPINNHLIPVSIALATSHPMGIGDSTYRFVNTQVKQVDTVPYGCFKRSVFEEIGLFDTDLVRNQDDEFNGRIIKNGGKIYLVPHLQITYYARSTIKGVMKMFYQYGLFKPLVNVKLGSPATLRQFAPPMLLLFFAFGMLLPFLPSLLVGGWLAIFSAYIILALLSTLQLIQKSKRWGLLLVCPWLFLIIHLSYGWGYLKGFILVHVFKQKPNRAKITISR